MTDDEHVEEGLNEEDLDSLREVAEDEPIDDIAVEETIVDPVIDLGIKEEEEEPIDPDLEEIMELFDEYNEY